MPSVSSIHQGSGDSASVVGGVPGLEKHGFRPGNSAAIAPAGRLQVIGGDSRVKIVLHTDPPRELLLDNCRAPGAGSRSLYLICRLIADLVNGEGAYNPEAITGLNSAVVDALFGQYYAGQTEAYPGV